MGSKGLRLTEGEGVAGRSRRRRDDRDAEALGARRRARAMCREGFVLDVRSGLSARRRNQHGLRRSGRSRDGSECATKLVERRLRWLRGSGCGRCLSRSERRRRWRYSFDARRLRLRLMLERLKDGEVRICGRSSGCAVNRKKARVRDGTYEKERERATRLTDPPERDLASLGNDLLRRILLFR